MYNALSQIEIEQIEHPFIGKFFAKVRDNRAQKKTVRQSNRMERINARQAGGGVIGKIGNALSGVFGGGSATSDPAMMQERGLQLSFDDQAAIDAQKQKQTTTMIIVGVVVLVIVILLFVYLKNKKKEK